MDAGGQTPARNEGMFCFPGVRFESNETNNRVLLLTVVLLVDCLLPVY